MSFKLIGIEKLDKSTVLNPVSFIATDVAHPQRKRFIVTGVSKEVPLTMKAARRKLVTMAKKRKSNLIVEIAT